MRSSEVLLLLTKVGLSLFWGTAILVVLLSSVPESPFPFSSQERLNVTVLAPEGWAFFTRNPREPVQELYHSQSGRWVRYNQSNFSLHNWFGVKRLSTIENVELQHLLRQAGPDSTWTQCTGELQSCIHNRDLTTITVENKSNTKRFCDSLLVRKRKPIPWAWSDAEEPVVMSSSIVQLIISCKKRSN